MGTRPCTAAEAHLRARRLLVSRDGGERRYPLYPRVAIKSTTYDDPTGASVRTSDMPLWPRGVLYLQKRTGDGVSDCMVRQGKARRSSARRSTESRTPLLGSVCPVSPCSLSPPPLQMQILTWDHPLSMALSFSCIPPSSATHSTTTTARPTMQVRAVSATSGWPAVGSLL